MMRRRRLVAALTGGAVAVAVALLPAVAASAHDYLVSSDPAAGSTVTTPLDKVALTFNDRVLDLSGDGRSALLTVIGPGSKHFETGCATIADTDVTAPVALGSAGQYTVTYQIVSADGHTVSNSLAFTYQPPAGATPAPGSDATPCGATSAPTAAAGGTSPATAPPGSGSVVSTAKPTAAASDSDLGLVIGIAVAIVVLALVGVVIVVLTARRSRGPSDG